MAINEENGKTTETEARSTHKLKAFVFAFFTVLGGVTFFTFLFLIIYIQFSSPPKSFITPIADGKSIYEDMQRIETQKKQEVTKLYRDKRMRKFVSASRGRMRLNLDHARK